MWYEETESDEGEDIDDASVTHTGKSDILISIDICDVGFRPEQRLQKSRSRPPFFGRLLTYCSYLVIHVSII